MSAGRIAAAEIAFDNHSVLAIKYGTAEGAGRHTGHTFDTDFLVQFDSAGLLISFEGANQARLDTGGIVTL